MLSNLHTHTPFCDGKSTAEETVLKAIEKGFDSLGFSGHGFTPYDLRYCMKDTDGYIAEIRRLKEKYADEIQIYVGIEEDSFCCVERKKFDYIIGSSHYVKVGGGYYPVDSAGKYFDKCLELFGGDIVSFSENYYSSFCDYINTRKPDIIGHFDLVTKFSEQRAPDFFADEKYMKTAEKYVLEALKSGCLFEVNTGAIARGYRTTPYPDERLLYVIKKNGGRLVLTSDCHNADDLDCSFEEAKKMLSDIGFEYIYHLYDGGFFPDRIKPLI